MKFAPLPHGALALPPHRVAAPDQADKIDALIKFLKEANKPVPPIRVEITNASELQKDTVLRVQRDERHGRQRREGSGRAPGRQPRYKSEISCIAFPVHDRSGNVVAAHYRAKNGRDWFYYPLGAKVRPLVFGEMMSGERVQGFESTWDGLDYVDKSGERDAVIITCGAATGKFIAELVPESCPLDLWMHNDKGGQEWEHTVSADFKGTVTRVKIPAPYKVLAVIWLIHVQANRYTDLSTNAKAWMTIIEIRPFRTASKCTRPP